VRFTQLPDALEYPPNPNVLRGWWRKFQVIPDCPIKNAHVTVLRWLLDERVRNTGKGLPEKMVDVWDQTFGTIAVPAPRRRGVRRLQMNLFPEASDPEVDRLGNGSPSVDEPRFVSSAAFDPKPKEIKSPETVPEPFRNGRVQDQDQVSVSSLSGGGSGEGHDTGTSSSSRPHLAIVPESTPYTAEQMLKTLERDAKMRFVVGYEDPTLWPALRDVVTQLCERGIGLADLALLSSWMGRGLAVEGTEGRPYLGPWWAARPNHVLFAVQRARIAQQAEDRKAAEGDRRAAELRALLSEGPYTLPVT